MNCYIQRFGSGLIVSGSGLKKLMNADPIPVRIQVNKITKLIFKKIMSLSLFMRSLFSTFRAEKSFILSQWIQIQIIS